MAYELIGAAGMTNELKQYYSRRLYDRTMPLLVFLRDGFVTKDAIPARNGRSVEWRRFDRPSPTTTALTEGTPGAGTNFTVANVQATVSQYGRFAIFTELLELQAWDPYLEQTSLMLAEDMAISLDTIVRDVVVAGTTVQYASIAGSRGDVASGMRLNFAEIREVVSTLKNNDAPGIPELDDLFAGVMHPHVEYDFKGDSDVLASQQNAGVRGSDNPIFRGTIGDFSGIRFFVTSRATIGTSLGLSGADVYYTMVWGRGYYASVDYATMRNQIIIKPVGSAGAADPLNQRGTIGWKAAIAAARLDENVGARIESTSSLGNEGS